MAELVMSSISPFTPETPTTLVINEVVLQQLKSPYEGDNLVTDEESHKSVGKPYLAIECFRTDAKGKATPEKVTLIKSWLDGRMRSTICNKFNTSVLYPDVKHAGTFIDAYREKVAKAGGKLTCGKFNEAFNGTKIVVTAHQAFRAPGTYDKVDASVAIPCNIYQIDLAVAKGQPAPEFEHKDALAESLEVVK